MAGVTVCGEPIAITDPDVYHTTVEPPAHVAEILVDVPAQIVVPALDETLVAAATTGET